MKRPSGQWAHAAKVALGATAIVAVVAVVGALAVNLVILHRLDRGVDARLSERLASASRGSVDPLRAVTGTYHEGDLDDAPSFVWTVTPSGKATALTVGAPVLPVRRWAAGFTTMAAAGSTFRFDAVSSGGRWLVAGESVLKISQAHDDLLITEGLFGALLLLVTFAGSFVVGLRASAPIEQIRRRQAEFTADASHELRTPLSVIEAEVDLALSRERDVQSYRAALRRVSSESGRLQSIVDDLLWLARADADPHPELSDSVADVTALAQSCVERFGAVADSMSVTLTNRGDHDGPLLIRADAEAIDRLIAVLLDNACRYAGDGGSVDLRVSHGGGRARLTVDDSGPGIPEHHRELVFDRFHRAGDERGGTGLGLAIADAVVRNSGGTWSVGTSPLGGAHMEVSWRQAPTHPSMAANQVPDSPTAPEIRT
ncbi:MAG TPA: HAMP domain-containing sensor histidine kinase [Acidimicrobiales bacterium]|nr:HAMP domain-containing sensor histidine kinase [Acidimicrobiales bacterium]